MINQRGLAGLIALFVLGVGCAAPTPTRIDGGGEQTAPVDVPGADANVKEGPCSFCPQPPVRPPVSMSPVPSPVPLPPTSSAEVAPMLPSAPPPAPIDSWEPLVVTDIRFERHDGYDRIIYGFGGLATPGWRAEYVAEATPRGQPTALHVVGRSILQIYFFLTSTAPDLGGYRGPTPLADSAARAVTEVHLAPSYQSYPHGTDLSTQTFIGTTHDRPPIKVEVLFDPLRLAVDIHV